MINSVGVMVGVNVGLGVKVIVGVGESVPVGGRLGVAVGVGWRVGVREIAKVGATVCGGTVTKLGGVGVGVRISVVVSKGVTSAVDN